MLKLLQFSFTHNFEHEFVRYTMTELIDSVGCEDTDGNTLGELEQMRKQTYLHGLVNDWLLTKLYDAKIISEEEINEFINEHIISIDSDRTDEGLKKATGKKNVKKIVNWAIHTDGGSRYEN